MSEKMRGALFNVLGDIGGLSMFDAYGGSGAVVFESISRGAKSALITETDKKITDIIKKNIKILNLENQIKVVHANASGWSEKNYTTQFDLVICDPPYDLIKESQLKTLTQNVKKSGLFILSLPSEYPRPRYDDLKLERDRDYGQGSLVFYRKI